jgi:hypothetical protein
MKKIAQTPTSEDLSDLPDLPATVITKDRQTLSTAGDVWRLRANADGGGWVDIDFRPMRRFGTARFVAITQLFVARNGERLPCLQDDLACARRRLKSVHAGAELMQQTAPSHFIPNDQPVGVFQA